MKKLLFIVLMGLSLCSWAQKEIKISNGYAVEWTNGKYRAEQTRIEIPKFMLRYQLRANLRALEVRADNYLYINKAKSFKFRPELFIFDIRLGYNLNDRISIYAKHRCVHPIATSDRLATRVYGGFDLIGISYNIK